MKKKYQLLSMIAIAAILVSMIAMSAISVSAEQQGTIKLEYNHTDPAANQGNPAGTGQDNQTQSNAKTGDATTGVIGGLSIAVAVSAGTAWLAFKKRKKQTKIN